MGYDPGDALKAAPLRIMHVIIRNTRKATSRRRPPGNLHGYLDGRFSGGLKPMKERIPMPGIFALVGTGLSSIPPLSSA